MIILCTLLLVGTLLGVVGADGAGVVIAVLTFVFHVPIHLALGTSLAAMTFTTLSGAISHYREGNVALRLGTFVGAFGAMGAFAGAKTAIAIPATYMHFLTGTLMVLSSMLLYVRVYHSQAAVFTYFRGKAMNSGPIFWIKVVVAGVGSGYLSGTFGIGATVFIQLALMIFFGLTIYEAIGTTMMVIIPIAFMGGVGYMLAGFLDVNLFLYVVIGLICGAYIGAKFTRRLPAGLLKCVMVVLPALGGVVLLLE